MSPVAPSVSELDAAVAKVKAELKRRLDELAKRLPEGERPTPEQIQALVNEWFANGSSVAEIINSLKNDVIAVLVTGKGKSTSNPSALA